jgi:hypothetical protein
MLFLIGAFDGVFQDTLSIDTFVPAPLDELTNTLLGQYYQEDETSRPGNPKSFGVYNSRGGEGIRITFAMCPSGSRLSFLVSYHNVWNSTVNRLSSVSIAHHAFLPECTLHQRRGRLKWPWRLEHNRWCLAGRKSWSVEWVRCEDHCRSCCWGILYRIL